MGFWSRLFGLFGRKKKQAKNDKPAAKAATPAANGVTKATPAAKATSATDDAGNDLQPQCGALTASGGQCKRSARQGSKYCGLHKGYRPPTAAVASAAEDTAPTVKGAKDTKPSARGASNGETASRPQCAAITAAGDQCKSSARQSSKYCGRHKGYRVPNAATASTAKDTLPKAKRARDTAPSSRRSHVSHNGYKLYQKGNRYFFSKKSQTEAKKNGAEPVYQMPSDREVKETPNGLPVLKKA